MTGIVMLVVLGPAVLLQMGLPAFASLGQARAPLLLAAVLYYALNRDTGVMLAAALAAALLQDALSPVPLGTSAACFCVIGWVASRFKRIVLSESHVTAGFFGGLASGLLVLWLYLLFRHSGLVSVTFRWVLLKALGTAVLGVIASPFVFALAGWLDRQVGNVHHKEVVHDFE